MKKVKFVIVSPRQESGGAIALHRLCECLNELGYDAKILYSKEPHYEGQKRWKFWLKWFYFSLIDTILKALYGILKGTRLVKCKAFKAYSYEPITSCHRKILPIIEKDTILVYPDIYYGNIFGAKNVVRWLLYYNRFSRESYGKRDLFFAYREIFNDEILNPEKQILKVAYFDLNLYKRTNYGERTGKCYVIRKGASRPDVPKKFDGPVIDDIPEKEKVRIFNQCKYCISYDMQTAYASIAALCGCISVMIPEEGKTWIDYREPGEKHNGIALGFSEAEIQHAQKTSGEILRYYKNLNAEGKNETKKFAEKCITYFGIENEN